MSEFVMVAVSESLVAARMVEVHQWKAASSQNDQSEARHSREKREASSRDQSRWLLERSTKWNTNLQIKIYTTPAKMFLKTL